MRALLDIPWRGKVASLVVGSVILGWAYFDTRGFSHAACEYGKQEVRVVLDHLPPHLPSAGKVRAARPAPPDICNR